MRESYRNALDAGIEKRYRQLEYDIMEDVVRRIQKAGKITSTADWQLNRMLILGKSSSDLQKIVASAVQYDDEEVQRLYDEVIQNEYTVYKPQYEKISREFIPYKDNLQLQQLVEAQIRNSNDELKNVTRSMGFMLEGASGRKVWTPLSEVYSGYLDQAVTDIASGAFDYNTVIRKVCKQLTDSGLRTTRQFAANPDDYSGVDYSSGWHNRIDVAARRAIMTGISQLSGQIMDMNAERLGVDKFEVSWHVGARPSHALWQGRVYTRKQLETVCGLGSGDGLLGWNCRHEYYPFFPGSKRQYSDEWLRQQAQLEAQTKTFRGREYNTYEATQKQRRMETNMRAQREKVKLMQAGGADPDDIVIERCKYQAQLDEYREFSKKFGMKTQAERVYYDRKGRVAPSSKQYREWKQERNDKYREWLHSIGADGTSLKTVDEYEEARYSKDREYVLLKGYSKAVQKGDINVLTGFKRYRQTAIDVEDKIVGMTTSDGVQIQSYTMHFIDRVIGQTSTPHKDMRLGVPVADAYDALKHPDDVSADYVIRSGDVRRTYYGRRASVAISITDKRLIQTNPTGGK